MDPKVWGPSFWFVLHTVSLNYPDRPTYVEKRTHHDFYRVVQDILPCVTCRQHYKELSAQYPIGPFLTSKKALVTWVTMIHNQVNKRLGKATLTTEEVTANYTKVYARGSFCDPAKCPELECEEKEEEGPIPAVVAACAGGATVAVLLLGLGVWYAVRKRGGNE